MTLTFIKGHATGNDFVILPDPEGKLVLDQGLVRAWCDRRRGIGADGVLRVVRSSVFPESAAHEEQPEWFMDYRNADGSFAEMCGNGARLFARFLVDEGLVPPGSFQIATRAGVKKVQVPPHGDVAVVVGEAQIGAVTSVSFAQHTFPAVAVTTGPPHAVCLTSAALDTVDLSAQPVVDSAVFPQGTNVEIVNVHSPTKISLRVWERGVGETLSCGTGATAAAALVMKEHGTEAVEVQLPGGSLTVTREENNFVLTGPAVVVARGQWLGSV